MLTDKESARKCSRCQDGLPSEVWVRSFSWLVGEASLFAENVDLRAALACSVLGGGEGHPAWSVVERKLLTESHEMYRQLTHARIDAKLLRKFMYKRSLRANRPGRGS